MGKNSEMDWAHHIKIDYAQNLSKGPVKAKRKAMKANSTHSNL